MSTFLDLYTRFLDDIGAEARVEAEGLVAKMCGSAGSSDEHADARRSLVRLVKSRAPQLLPESWLLDPRLEDGLVPGRMEKSVDDSLRKEWKSILEDEGVYFWGRVPEWNEIEKHYGLKGWVGNGFTPDSRGQYQPHENHQVDHGDGLGVRHMVMRIITNHFHGDLEAAGHALGRPGMPLRDLVRFEGDGAYAEHVKNLFNQVFPDGASRDAAAQGTQRAGDNFKLSAPVGAPQDAADVHQNAYTHHREAGQGVARVRGVEDMVAAGGSLDSADQRLQEQLNRIEGYKTPRGVAQYMARLRSERSTAQGKVTRLQNSGVTGEQLQAALLDSRNKSVDFVAAYDAWQHLAEHEGGPPAALTSDKSFMASQDKAINTATWHLSHVTSEETRQRVPGNIGPAAPHEVPAAHGHAATQGEVPSHQVVPREHAGEARATKPEHLITTRPPAEHAPAAPPAEHAPTAPPAEHAPATPAAATPSGQRGQRLPAQRGQRLPTTQAAPPVEHAPAPAPPAEHAPLSDVAARGRVQTALQEMGVTAKPAAENKAVQFVQAHPDLTGAALHEGILDAMPDAGYSHTGTPETPKAPAAPAAPRPARTPARGGVQPGQNLPGMAGLMVPGSNAPSAVRVTAGAQRTPNQKIQAEVDRWRKDMESHISANKPSKVTEPALKKLEAAISASYAKKDSQAVVDSIKTFVKQTGVRAGKGNWYAQIKREMDAEFAKTEGKAPKGVKKSARLPIGIELPARLPMPGDVPARLPVDQL